MARILLHALLGMALVMGFHFWPQSNSMFLLKSTWDSPDSYIAVNYLNEVVRLHQVEPSFATRPITTWLILGTSKITGLQPGVSFIVTSFGLLFLSFFALLSLSKVLHGKSSLLTSLSYTFTFSIFFAWFPNIYTYDEPLQYTLLFLSLLFLQRKKLPLSLLILSAAIFVRENSLFLVPGYLYLAGQSFRLKKIPVVVACCILVISVILLKKWLIPVSEFSDPDGLISTKRLEHLYYNFQTREFSIESLFMPVLAILVPVSLLLHHHPSKHTPYLKAFLVTFVINCILVLFLAKAREARLFSLPLVFVWPLLHSTALVLYPPHKIKRKQYILIITGVLSFFTLAGLFSLYIYRPTEVEVLVTKYRIYAFISLAFFVVMFFWPKDKKIPQ